MSNKVVIVDPGSTAASPDGSPSSPFPTIAQALASSAMEHVIASIDFPAPAKLTVTLGLLASGELLLSLFWNGDRTHDIGTRRMASWAGGRWTCRPSGVASEEATDETRLIREFRWALVRGDFSGRSIRAFMRSGVLQGVVRDVRSHHLTLSVMGS